MKRVFTVLAVLNLFSAAYAMEIALPDYVVEHYLIAHPENGFDQNADAKKILKHNPKHTKKYVMTLLKSLQGKQLKIESDKAAYLTVKVLSPKRVDFLFEHRTAKAPGDDVAHYFVLIGINEVVPNKNSEPDGSR